MKRADPAPSGPASRRHRRAGSGWPASLAAGFSAGTLAGAALLAIALAQRGADIFAYWTAAGFALALAARSAGLYPLLLGAAGLALAAATRLVPALRDARRAFALVLGAMAAALALAHLTAWWQLEVLAGAPFDHPARARAALLHGALALSAGAATAGLSLRSARRRRDGGPSVRATGAALGAALVLVVLGEAGLRLAERAGEPAAARRPGQVVVIGLDGMTLRVLSPLLRAGELPAFRRLMAEGAWGTLLTYGTASSPRVWTSMATGKRVRDHGIDDFVREPGSGYRAVTLKSFDWRARPVWSVLSDAGRRGRWSTGSPPTRPSRSTASSSPAWARTSRTAPTRRSSTPSSPPGSPALPGPGRPAPAPGSPGASTGPSTSPATCSMANRTKTGSTSSRSTTTRSTAPNIAPGSTTGPTASTAGPGASTPRPPPG